MRLYENQPSGTVSQLRTLRRNATEAEKRLRRALKEAFPTLKWRCQAPVGPYRADFLCFSQRLIIEVDGVQHSQEADAARTRYLEHESYRILRFWNNEVLENTAGVLAQISLSLREREGAPKARKGEGDEVKVSSPSPSHANAWAPPSPVGRGA